MATWTYYFPHDEYPTYGAGPYFNVNYTFGSGVLDFHSLTSKLQTSSEAVYQTSGGVKMKLYGEDFHYNKYGNLTHGSITEILFIDSDGDKLLSLSKLSVDAAAFKSAASSYDAWHFQDWVMSGNDIVNGSDGSDEAYGGSGNDLIKGGAGDDYVSGGDGDDVLRGDDGKDFLSGGSGKDSYDGGSGRDLLSFTDAYSNANALHGATVDATKKTVVDPYGNHETFKSIEEFRGTQFADTFKGSDVNEAFTGLGGADKIDGGAGFDTIRYDIDQYAIGIYPSYENRIGVTVRLDKGYAIDAFHDKDKLSHIEGATGTDFADHFYGNSGDNTFYGRYGNDIFYAHGGDDRLYGGQGNDRLKGGDGKDSFVFTTKPDSEENHDVISDFYSKDDTIELAKSVFKAFTHTGAIDSDAFLKNTTGHAADKQDHIIYNSKTGDIFYDADGSGSHSAVLFASIEAGTVLSYKDFLII